jgi:hypothetical protein
MLLTIIIDVRPVFEFVYRSSVQARPFCDKTELELDTRDIIRNQVACMFAEVNGTNPNDYTQVITDNAYRLNCMGVPEEQAWMICSRCESMLIEAIYTVIPQLDNPSVLQVISFEMITPGDLVLKARINDPTLLAVYQNAKLKTAQYTRVS